MDDPLNGSKNDAEQGPTNGQDNGNSIAFNRPDGFYVVRPQPQKHPPARAKLPATNRPKPIVVRGDWNLSQLPLLRQRSRHQKDNQPIVIERWKDGKQIGTVSLSGQLSKGAYLFYEELQYLFREMGCPASNAVYDSMNAIMGDLYIKRNPGMEPVRYGKRDKEWVKKKIAEISDIHIKFDGCYELGDQRLTELVRFNLLESAYLFEKSKSDKHFSLSKFSFPNYVAQNIRSGKTKPLRLDILMSLKSDTAIAIYRFIDPMLYAHERYEKDFDDLCHEMALNYKHKMKGVHKLREACKELIGKELSGPFRISRCDIESSETPSGYKLIAVRADRRTAPRIAITNGKPVVDTHSELEAERRYYAFFQGLPPEKQKEIEDMLTPEFLKSICGEVFWEGSMARSSARLEAIKLYYERQVTKCAVATAKGEMVARDGAAPFRMGKTLEQERSARRDAFRALADALIFYGVSRL